MYTYLLSRLEIPYVTCELEFELSDQPMWLFMFDLPFHANVLKNPNLFPFSIYVPFIWILTH